MNKTTLEVHGLIAMLHFLAAEKTLKSLPVDRFRELACIRADLVEGHRAAVSSPPTTAIAAAAALGLPRQLATAERSEAELV
jgi:hypothetical protein